MIEKKKEFEQRTQTILNQNYIHSKSQDYWYPINQDSINNSRDEALNKDKQRQ